MSEGSKTVRRGTESSKLYLSLLNSFLISLAHASMLCSIVESLFGFLVNESTSLTEDFCVRISRIVRATSCHLFLGINKRFHLFTRRSCQDTEKSRSAFAVSTNNTSKNYFFKHYAGCPFCVFSCSSLLAWL